MRPNDVTARLQGHRDESTCRKSLRKSLILVNPASREASKSRQQHKFCVFPNPALCFVQIRDPEGTLPDPVYSEQYRCLNSPLFHSSPILPQGVLRVRKRVTLMVITVSVIFGVCWLADTISFILTSFSSHHTSSDMSYIATGTLILFNSAINPIVYALVNQKFRAKIKSTVSCPCSVTRKLQLTDVRVGCKAEAFEHSPYLAAVIRIPENKISNARALSVECIAI